MIITARDEEVRKGFGVPLAMHRVTILRHLACSEIGASVTIRLCATLTRQHHSERRKDRQPVEGGEVRKGGSHGRLC